MKYLNKKNLLVLIPSITMFVTACSYDVNSFSPIPHSRVLKNANGGVVNDCKGHWIGLGYEANKFWKDNKLPKGTINFVCVEGKAYLKGQEPKL